MAAMAGAERAAASWNPRSTLYWLNSGAASPLAMPCDTAPASPLADALVPRPARLNMADVLAMIGSVMAFVSAPRCGFVAGSRNCPDRTLLVYCCAWGMSGFCWNCSKPCLSSGRLCCSGCCTGPHGPTSTFASCVCLLDPISETLFQRRSDLLPPAPGELALPAGPATHLKPVAPLGNGPFLEV